MDNTDPIQVARLFSDCGRAFPFYGIPAKEIPESPFFSHEFQVALLSGIRIARNSAAILDHLLVRQNRRELTGSSVKQSGEWIPGTKTIAFLGNSAAGKSSVINALLDFPDIASTVRKLELSGKLFILIKGNREILAQQIPRLLPNTGKKIWAKLRASKSRSSIYLKALAKNTSKNFSGVTAASYYQMFRRAH